MLLGWEQHDPALQAVHFLTVASYNLQHPAAFTEEALAALAESLRQHLDEGLPVAAIRRAMAVEFAGRTRVTRNQADRQSVLRRWTITIADVYLPDRPAGAAERVHAWAASILRERASSDG